MLVEFFDTSSCIMDSILWFETNSTCDSISVRLSTSSSLTLCPELLDISWRYPGWHYIRAIGYYTPELPWCDTVICEYSDCESVYVDSCIVCPPCCSLAIAFMPDTICQGDEVELCAYLEGDSCPFVIDIHLKWTTDDVIIATSPCITVSPDTTTEYCFNGWYIQSIECDTCFYDICVTVWVIAPPNIDLWPEDTTVCVGESLWLPVPCIPYIPFGFDETIDVTIIEAYSYSDTTFSDPDTIAIFDLTDTLYDWCYVRHIARVPGWPAHIVCYDVYTEDCYWHWVECCTIYVCDTPSVVIEPDSLPCPEDGFVEVCAHSLNPGAPIDVAYWSTGATTYWPDNCIDVPVTPITTSCGGINSFEPETVWVEGCHVCDDGIRNISCCDYDTAVIEPYFTFELEFIPSTAHPGDPFIIYPWTDPSLEGHIPEIEWDLQQCLDDSLVGVLRHNAFGDSVTVPFIDSTLTYCSWFTYNSCEYWACNSMVFAETLLTIIKSPCAGDPDGWIEVDSYRRYIDCKYTFPVYGGCADICVSDTDFVISDSVWVFDSWESPLGTPYSYNSCVTYCLASAHDTIYAIYKRQDICLGIDPFNPIYSDISIEIEDSLVSWASVYTDSNINTPKKFNLTNCGDASLNLKIKWISTSNMSIHPCPLIELTNSPRPDYNHISLRKGVSELLTTAPTSYDVIKDYYTNVASAFEPGSVNYLYIGVVSPDAYHPCYPDGSHINYKIKLRLMWSVHLD